MPFMKKVNGKSVRDYQAEKEWDHRNGKRLKDRAARNAARKKLGLKVGDPRDAGHKKARSKGGGNGLANLFAQNASQNQSFSRNKDGSMKSETSKRERKTRK